MSDAPELYPVVDDEASYLEVGAMMAMAQHWRIYLGHPEQERLGDESAWESIFVQTLSEGGIGEARAMELSNMAKLDAAASDKNTTL